MKLLQYCTKDAQVTYNLYTESQKACNQTIDIKPMKSLTYSHLPTEQEFIAAFDAANLPYGFGKHRYELNLNSSDSAALVDFKLSSGLYSACELWECVNEIVKKWRITPAILNDDGIEMGSKYDYAMDVVSSILYILGWEWI